MSPIITIMMLDGMRESRREIRNAFVRSLFFSSNGFESSVLCVYVCFFFLKARPFLFD